MAYKITRNLVHNANHGAHRFVDYMIYDVSFIDEIQPLYPTLAENDYYAIINEFTTMIEPLSDWRNLCAGFSGFVNYSYSFNGIPQFLGVTDYEQVFLFIDQESYAAWQLQEKELGNNRISKWYASLEEKSIDFSNIIISGTQMINTVTEETTDMPVIKYLTTKYFIERKTQISVVHVIE